MLTPNFQEQTEADLDTVFFNVEAKELVKRHTIGGIRNKQPVELDIVADHELYKERAIKDSIENISLDGVVIFVKRDLWLDAFGYIPKFHSAIKFDHKDYLIEAVDDDMGTLELTLRGARG